MHRCCLAAALALFVVTSSAAPTSAEPGDPVPTADDWRVRGALTALDSGDPALTPQAFRLLAQVGHTASYERIVAGKDLLMRTFQGRSALAYALGKLQTQPERSVRLLIQIAAEDHYAENTEACRAIASWQTSKAASALAEVLAKPPAGVEPETWYQCVGIWDVAGIEALIASEQSQKSKPFWNTRATVIERIWRSEEIVERLRKAEQDPKTRTASNEILKALPASTVGDEDSRRELSANLQEARDDERIELVLSAIERGVTPQLDPAISAKIRPLLLERLRQKVVVSPEDSIWLALLAAGPISRAQSIALIESTYNGVKLSGEQLNSLQFWAIVLSGGDSGATLAALSLVAYNKILPHADRGNARKIIEATVQVIEEVSATRPPSITANSTSSGVESSAVELLLRTLRDTKWTAADREFLEGLRDALNEPQYQEVRAQIQEILDGLATEAPTPLYLHIATWALATFGLHLLIWLGLLVTIYPRSRTVQALMMFNPLGRAVTGLGYTQLLVLVVPWLRYRLFHPLVDASRDTEVASFDAASFYDRIQVAPLVPQKNPQAPVEVKPPIAWTALQTMAGLIVIEGASGLGKTHVLKALLERARAEGRTCLFLRAAECNSGVLSEIEERLAIEHSSGFVRSMLHRGAIELFIDGLNEASPSGVAAIAQFCENARAARILITTQPLAWPCPRHAQQFRLLPLAPDELEAFLVAQWPAVRTASDTVTPEAEAAAKAAYVERARAFLAASASPQDLAVLQSRIDLAFVAHLLARAEVPNIHSLRKQVVDDAARAYEAASPGGRFPLAELAAAALRVLETGRPALELKDLDPAVLPHLAERKLLLRRNDADWLFRHDTITCYFAAAGHFAPKILASIEDDGSGTLDPQAVTKAHLDNQRFTGVYLQLAESLPLPAAKALGTALREHGRVTQDRTLEIAYQDRVDRRIKLHG